MCNYHVCNFQIPIDAILNKGSPGLETLDLSNNELTDIAPETFLRLNSTLVTYPLQKLHLSNNHLTRIAADSFLGLDALNVLELWSNDIEKIEPGAWTGLESLQELFLDDNKLTRVEKKVFSGSLSNSVRYLQLGRNQLTQLDAQSIPNRVRNLDLHENKLTSLPKRAFYNNKILGVLDISHNNLTELTKDMFLLSPFTLLKLKTANLFFHNNGISEIGNETFTNFPFLWYLQLSNNQIASITAGMLKGAPSIGRLHLEHNLISNIEQEAFRQQKWIRNLYLNHNKLESIEQGMFAGLRDLMFLQLDHNQLSTVHESELRRLAKMFFVKLNDNKLTTLPSLLFESSDRVIEGLWLQNNQLVDSSWEAIMRIQRIRELDLSNNNYKMIPTEAFRGTEVLNLIFLNENSISNIGEKAFRNHNKIDLKNNNLTTLHSSSWLPETTPKVLILEGENVIEFMQTLFALRFFHIKHLCFLHVVST